jgi:hypothetical protein
MKIVDDIKARLVPNISEVLWLHWSTRAMALAVGIPALWALLPTKWQDEYFWAWIPQYLSYMTMGLGLLALVCKFIKQDLPSDKAAP